MAKRSYVPRHAVVQETTSPTARKAVTVLAASVGVAAATTALANPADAKAGHHGVWDRVASCESGQRWHVDTGNGFYGGLQFTASTWRAYHGHKYAVHAQHATRMQQIQVARRVLKSQGPDAWPVCGPRAGLTMSSGHATAAALPKDASTHTGTGHSKKSHLKTHQGHHKNQHHKNGHHKAGHHKSRTHASGVYVVRRGDTLSKIAQREHVHGGWHALYRANRKHLHGNPNVLHVGEHLRLP
ncbi:MAG: LysM peptidoglycan-binding domain-containing protein [Jatrophihabitans endophyticus]|nr:LysM peptidoglycan-binding domain-containing protein [Jatrophihabitans endophyticus]